MDLAVGATGGSSSPIIIGIVVFLVVVIAIVRFVKRR